MVVNKTRIAVISDTHGRLPSSLVATLVQADEIWHLGDVTDHSILEPLRELPVSLHVVQGNCDPPGLWPPHLDFERGGIRFRLQHYPPDAYSEAIDIFLHGHLHRPINKKLGTMRVLSPGAVTGPRGGSQASFAWLLISENMQYEWDVETLADLA